LEDGHVVALVEGVLAKRDGAWPALIGLVHPHLERMAAASSSLGPLRGSEDHRKNAISDVLAKLARNNYRALSLLAPWLAANPGRGAGDWLRIVSANAIREYVTRQIGNDATRRFLHTLADPLSEAGESGLRPPVTTQQTARQILDYATAHLPDVQLRALKAWLQQSKLGDEDQRRVRAALARLRREFA